jgi:hypothetical protein
LFPRDNSHRSDLAGGRFSRVGHRRWRTRGSNRIDRNFFDPHLVASYQNIERITDRRLTGINPVYAESEHASEMLSILITVIHLLSRYHGEEWIGRDGFSKPFMKCIPFAILEGNSIGNRKKNDCSINCDFSLFPSWRMAHLRTLQIDISCL